MGTWWVESHQSLSRHRKTIGAVAILKVDRHKLIGHLHELWWWGLDNADIHGLIGNASNEMIAEAAGWPIKDAKRFTDALMTVRFLERDADGTVVLHDWYQYAGKLNKRRAEDAERKRISGGRPTEVERRSTGTPVEIQRNSGGNPAEFHTDSVRTVPNLNVPDNPPLSPLGDGASRRKPVPKAKPERVPLNDDDVESLVTEFADSFGSPQAVRDEIEVAMNHTARTKAFKERIYVVKWLKRELEQRPAARLAKARPEPPRRIVDRTGRGAA